jgi:hypothetical protein
MAALVLAMAYGARCQHSDLLTDYGVYDLIADEGWVSVGITRDTATFAVNSILSWWEHLGREHYPDATTLTITADCGGSNSSPTRLWKVELQR